MKKKIMFFIGALILLSFGFGCSDDETNNNTDVSIDFEDIQVHDQFDYATTTTVNVNLTVLNGSGDGVANIPFRVFDKAPIEGGNLFESIATNENGIADVNLTIPSYLEELFIEGFMSSQTLPIENNQIRYEFGAQIDSVAIDKQEIITPKKRAGLEYVLDYDSYGIPYGMAKDVVPAGFLTKINATLPEGRPVTQYHPDYLNSTNQLNVVVIDEAADVWVTYVHEGAGHKNSLGYYTYQEGFPPQNRDDIEVIKVIFPNVSEFSNFWGSARGLVTGDKVYLGQFEPGTIIGWVLMSNGWSDGQANLVENSWFSNTNLNQNNNQQSIMALDTEYDKLLFAFEDLVFEEGDDDFNDAVFYVTANPIESVDTGDIPPVDTPDDRDEDGISDIFDDFPDDPERAFHTNNNNRSSLVFEDLWPQKGDYDFNDMVIDYNMFFHKNVEGKATNLITEFELRAVGARNRNGFAVEFPFPASNIASMNVIDGSDMLTYSYVISDARFHPNLESDGEKAVIIYVNNTVDYMDSGSSEFVNTQDSVSYIYPVTLALDIKFNIPEDITDWSWDAPYNPFIFVDRDRSHEIHLVDYPPTSKANLDLFGLNDDDTNAGLGRYYKTINNHPWALNIAESFEYPYERAKINQTYHKFKAWAESSGESYADWYKDLPGYRNDELIYQQP